MDDEEHLHAATSGLDRRTLLKRGAVVGGAAVWATPVVQSLARPAFAAGSPVCTELYRFKYDVEEGHFDNGLPSAGSTAAQCLPDGYAEAAPLPASGGVPDHPGSVTFAFAPDGKSAEIFVPPGCVLLDGDAKAGGQGNSTLVCDDAQFVRTEPDGRRVYTVALEEKQISFIAGVVCCS